MPITLTIKMLSGDTLNLQIDSRGRSVKESTIQKRVESMVVAHLELDPSRVGVFIIHDDDDERLGALLHEESHELYGLHLCDLSHWDLKRLRTTVAKTRDCVDGMTLNVLVENFWFPKS